MANIHIELPKSKDKNINMLKAVLDRSKKELLNEAVDLLLEKYHRHLAK